ncbi:ferritin-like domain-containing protein [Telluribacter humicola]|uniref:ferritin-like domain-containing protein n=1 Tax=Telluribacter humicola TaxID=1720261 RepID=UPI001A973B25|nr:PA2169 family four-helix-bundle protein [Telluribacter humicola]
MANYDEKIHGALQSLVKLHIDRIKGYEHAKEDTEDRDRDLIMLFDHYITQSKKFKSELNSELINYNGKIPEDSTFAGKLHKAWMDLKSALTDRDREAVLNECEHGDKVLREGYEKVLNTEEMVIPMEMRTLIQNQYDEILMAYDRIKVLRNAESHH